MVKKSWKVLNIPKKGPKSPVRLNKVQKSPKKYFKVLNGPLKILKGPKRPRIS